MDFTSLNTAIRQELLRPIMVYAHPDDYDDLVAKLPEDLAGHVQIVESKWLVRRGEALVVNPANVWGLNGDYITFEDF